MPSFTLSKHVHCKLCTLPPAVADLVLVRGKDLRRFFFFSLLHFADILSLVSGAALVQIPDSRSLFRGVRTATAIDPACRSANLFERTVSHFFCRPCS